MVASLPVARERLFGPISAAAAILALLFGAGCATDIARKGSVYQHRRHGYTIGVPESHWEPIGVDGAVLAFRSAEGDFMSMMSRCRGTAAPAALLARRLLIGLDERALRQAGPVLIEGRNGWGQVLDARFENRAVRIKTITVVADACVIDWVLVSPGDFAVAERSFDGWWSTFRGERASSVGAGGTP
jgi:hypothetical protein